MLIILNKWLSEIEKEPCEYTQLSLKPKLFDAVIIGKILKYYDIITTNELALLEESADPNTAYCNYLNIKQWLKRIKFKLTREEINDIIEYEGTTGLEFLIKLYAELVNDHTVRRYLEDAETRSKFILDIVNEKEFGYAQPDQCAEPLKENFDVIGWLKDRMAVTMKIFAESRAKYLENMQGFIKNLEPKPLAEPERIFRLPDPPPKYEVNPDDLTLEDLVCLERKALSMPKFVPNLTKAKKIKNDIKQRHKEKAEVKREFVEMQKRLLSECWGDLQKKQEEDFNARINDKLLTKSIVEKKIDTKLFRIKYEKILIKKRAVAAYETWQKLQDENYIKKLLKDSLDARMKFHDDRQYINRLNEYLYEERMKLQSKKHQKLCQDVMEDVVELAIKGADYKKIFREEPNVHLKHEWTALFVKQQPILDLVTPLDDLKRVFKDLPDFIEETYNKELVRQDAIDDEDFDDYHFNRGVWVLNETFSESEASNKIINGINILGFIIHRLLLMKYPKEKIKKPNLPPNIKVACCLILEGGEKSVYEVLRRFLALYEIDVVTVEEVVEYCVLAYKTECTVEYREQVPEDFEEKKVLYPSPPDVKKPLKPPPKITVTGEKISKVAQTPRTYPGHQIILSRKAELGKIVVERREQELDPSINDRMFAEMFVQYLIDKPKLKGWVLINYPTSYEQAALLESVLTAKEPPKNYFEKILKQFSLESMKLRKEPSAAPLDQISLLSKNDIILNYLKNVCVPEEECGCIEHFSMHEQEVKEEEEEKSVVKKSSTLSSIKSQNTEICRQRKVQQTDPDLVSVLDYDFQLTFDKCSCIKTNFHHTSFVTLVNEDCFCRKCERERLKEQYKNYSPKISTSTFCEGDESENIEEEEEEFIENSFKKNRQSRLLPNIIELWKKTYKTVLTAYIRGQITPNPDKYDDEALIDYFNIPDGLTKFYTDQNCFYHLQYDELNNEIIETIGEIINEKHNIQQQYPISLYGDHYCEGHDTIKDLEVEKIGKVQKRGVKIMIKIPEPPGKKPPPPPKKPAQGGPTFDDKSSQFPEPEEIMWVDPPKPGERLWEFMDFPIPEVIGFDLATYWEMTEKKYITGFKEMFFTKRVLLNAIMPYVAYIKNIMDKYITQPDKRQESLHEAQKLFNSGFLEQRDNAEYKKYLINQVEEKKKIMTEISYQKLLETEKERTALIENSWIFRQLCQIVNNSQNGFQLEIDRLVDTVQIITDYYNTIVYQDIHRKPEDTFPKLNLEKSECSQEIRAELSNFFKRANVNVKIITGFHAFINEILKKSTNFVETTISAADNNCNALGAIIAPKKGPAKPKFVVDEAVLESGPNIIEEWHVVLEGEKERCLMRLELIKTELIARVNEVIKWGIEVFAEINEKIRDRCRKETESVEYACDLIAENILASAIFHNELKLEEDKLFEMQLKLFTEKIPMGDGKYIDASFTLRELEYMVDVLTKIAPDGVVMKPVFIVLLQDMLYVDEDSELDYEHVWRDFKYDTLKQHATILFGMQDYVYWKDLIIPNLPISFPTRMELMKTRNDFREFDQYMEEVISVVQYDKVRLWFEDKIDDKEMIRRLRELLKKMYLRDTNYIAYSSLLLAFCKDEDPVAGFVKALELSLGKYVCYNEEHGKKYVEKVLTERYLNKLKAAKKQDEGDVMEEDMEHVLHQLIDQIVTEHGDWVFEEEEGEMTEEKIPSAPAELVQNLSQFPVCNISSRTKIFTEFDYKYQELGFDNKPTSSKVVYILPNNLIMRVIDSCIPGHVKLTNQSDLTFLEDILTIFEKCRNILFYRQVLAHEFLGQESVQSAFKVLIRFSNENPIKYLKILRKEEEKGYETAEESVEQNDEEEEKPKDLELIRQYSLFFKTPPPVEPAKKKK